MSIRIITDSACDISKDKALAWGVTVLPLKTVFGTQEYQDGVTLSGDEFYTKLIETDVMPSTSQLSPFEYECAFHEAVDAGDTVLCLTLSSTLSGSFQSAKIAAEAFGASVRVVDTKSVSVSQQILIQRAVNLRDEGKTVDEITAVIEKEKHEVRIIALINTLEYLKRGGRISATEAVAGSILNIKPVVSLVDGSVQIVGKARGSKNGNNLLMELVRKEGGIDFTRPFALAYSGLSDKLLKKYIEDSSELYANQVTEFPISQLGSTIGTHAGPDAIVAAFFVRG